MTLNEYIDHMIKIRDAMPSMGELPVIYASDSEGNSYHRVHNTPGLFKVENFDAHYLEAEDTDDDTPLEEYNCVIVN